MLYYNRLFLSILLILAMVGISFFRADGIQLLGIFIVLISIVYGLCRRRNLARLEYATLHTISELSDKLEPGDIIMYHSSGSVADSPFMFNWYKYLLNDAFLHAALVLEHNGQKYIYQSLTDESYKKYRGHIPTHDQYIVGHQNKWTIFMEPLELYLYEDGVRCTGTFQVVKRNQHVSFDPEVNNIAITEKEAGPISHCNVSVGLYLAHYKQIKKHSYPFLNLFFYNPSSIVQQSTNSSIFYAKLK